MLIYDPQKRITAEEALNHPYVREFTNKSEEISYTDKINLELDDNKHYDINRYRDLLYERSKGYLNNNIA